MKAFVRGATAAAAGAIGGATVVLGRQAIVEVRTGVIAAAAFLLIWRFKGKEPFLILGAGALGLLLHR